MKVGTDGVLLGAWATTCGATHILDIGTGTGLIALMLAQRSDAQIVGIDIEAEAAVQAQENVQNSPWSHRIAIEHTDFQSFDSAVKFDLIVSNPPFFDNSLHSPNTGRTLARHAQSLSLSSLLQKTAQLLTPNGVFALILPADSESHLQQLAQSEGLHAQRITRVIPTPEAAPKRILAEFSFTAQNCLTDSLLIEQARHQYSDQYIALTRHFYLKMT
jgi:tRNA1Val (adenine37-N6)-methyltransferase